MSDLIQAEKDVWVKALRDGNAYFTRAILNDQSVHICLGRSEAMPGSWWLADKDMSVFLEYDGSIMHWRQ